MKRNRKLFISVILVFILVIAFSTAALADDPTEVVIDWNGGGFIGTSVNTGDATTVFTVNAAMSNGSFSAVDSNNNPYTYQVDNFKTKLVADVTNGQIITQTNRLTSKESSYGPAGQESYLNAFVIDGNVKLVDIVSTNYASMGKPTYGDQLPGGHNVVADADYYSLMTYIIDGQGNGGQVEAYGNGAMQLDCMNSSASGNGGIKLGHGSGCYTDANQEATGTAGVFSVTGVGNYYVKLEGMGIESAGGSIGIMANWTGSVKIEDFSLTANQN